MTSGKNLPADPSAQLHHKRIVEKLSGGAHISSQLTRRVVIAVRAYDSFVSIHGQVIVDRGMFHQHIARRGCETQSVGRDEGVGRVYRGAINILEVGISFDPQQLVLTYRGIVGYRSLRLGICPRPHKTNVVVGVYSVLQVDNRPRIPVRHERLAVETSQHIGRPHACEEAYAAWEILRIVQEQHGMGGDHPVVCIGASAVARIVEIAVIGHPSREDIVMPQRLGIACRHVNGLGPVMAPVLYRGEIPKTVEAFVIRVGMCKRPVDEDIVTLFHSEHIISTQIIGGLIPGDTVGEVGGGKKIIRERDRSRIVRYGRTRAHERECMAQISVVAGIDGARCGRLRVGSQM